MSCSGCLQLITEEEVICCTLQKCGKMYHIQCSNASRLTRDQVNKWICPDCNVSAKKSGDNTNTPIRQNENVTFRKKTCNSPGFIFTPPGDVPVSSSMQSLISEIQNLRQDMSRMESNFANRFDDLSAKLISYDARIKVLEEKEKENAILKTQVTQLQDQLNKQSHERLQSDLEILGVEETPNENPAHLVLTTAYKIGIELDERDLDYVSRVGPRNKMSNNEKVNLPRPLVVSFTRRTKREEFLKQAKNRRSLVSKDIVGNGSDRNVYVNERLTGETRRLFRSTRNWTKENDFRYCWVRDGVIYIRKRDGREGSPPIRIRSSEDLQKFSREPTTLQ